MKQLSCVAASRLLQAYYDGELQVSDQIAVSAHISSCEECAAALDDLRGLGSMLSTFSTGQTVLTGDAAAAFDRRPGGPAAVPVGVVESAEVEVEE